MPSLPSIRQKELDQYFTPCWAAQELYDAHFAHLDSRDHLLDLCCGNGNILSVVPSGVGASGVEIDSVMAQSAGERTGRSIITADFRDIELPSGVTAMFTNPPFDTDLIDAALDLGREILPLGGKFGMILPAYATQTSRRVMRWNRDWTIMQEGLPRDIFAGLSKPLVFCLFQKDTKPRLIGLRLYPETQDVRALPSGYQRMLIHGANGSRQTWRQLVDAIILEHGGRATLDMIYASMNGRQPATNRFWREKVRQTLYRHSSRNGIGEWCAAA